ncbi:DMT family transporter [Nesterenkonia alkaliphila]|uniref:EamA-like transporter family protein n=1 Tax=Nesterenkonia alkaliphila TaxID=1463631 RepID=A0A7K1UHC9_9MICC|nr:DMT family transporter [Nesterenkonia alkaliphila]MVT25839.1 EamA-like transporter family protein [Nesterenkonia alkaliphila]GFZ76692.1 membrane protein [Nesterenkonia alkaliphila]
MTPAGSASDHPARSPAVWLGLLLVMLAAGMAIPGQGRINAELSAHTGDPYLSALISFVTGLLLVCLIALCAPAGRRAVSRVVPAFRSGAVKWWYLLAGCVGGYFVLTQTLTIGMIGVAVFTVAVVTGQTIGGLLWDRIGLGPAGRRRISPMRVLGAALTVLAVLWAVSPQLAGADRGLLWLLLVILPFSGGFLNAAQQAVNGHQAAAYRSPIPATLFNFAAGSALLLLVWLGKLLLAGGVPGELPTVWWYYIGGPLGVVFIALGAVLVTKVGVLIAAMGMIAGQLLGSLLLDLLVPAPGSMVTAATVLGTVMTLLAVVVASLPDLMRGRGPGGR